jgi:hypothetical protein
MRVSADQGTGGLTNRDTMAVPMRPQSPLALVSAA